VIALVPAGLAVVVAAVLAVAGYAGGWIVTAAAGLSVLGLAVGWGDLLRLPHRSGTALLVGGLGAGALVAGTVTATRGQSGRPLAVFASVIAIAVLSALTHELLRRDGREDVVESATGTVTGQVLAVLATGWVLLAYEPAPAAHVVVAAAGLAAGRLVSALPLPLPEQVVLWIGVAFGAVGAVAATFFVPDVRLVTALVVGPGVAGVGAAIDRIFGPVDLDRRGFAGLRSSEAALAVLARAAAPVAAAGTVAYALTRITA
jgi:hypothetical protein